MTEPKVKVKYELPAPMRRAIVRTVLRVVLPAMIGLAVGSAVVIGSVWWALQQREEVRRERCAAVNSGQEYARRDNRAILDGVRALNTELVDQLTSAQSTPALADVDCDNDGWLERGEYLYVAPVGLPIEKIPNPTEAP
jgi:hypothetical protein